MEIVTAGALDASGFGGAAVIAPACGNGPVWGGAPADGWAPGLGKGKLAIGGNADDGFCGAMAEGGGVAAGGAETEGGGAVCDKVPTLNGEPGVGVVVGGTPMGRPRLMLGGAAEGDP
jgi:hypothetical protein